MQGSGRRPDPSSCLVALCGGHASHTPRCPRPAGFACGAVATMNRVTDDSHAPSAPVPPPPMAVVPTLPPPAIVAPVSAMPSRLWIVGAVVFGALSVAGFVSAWHTQQRVRALEQELVKRQQTSQED